jgi:hypothetical protein
METEQLRLAPALGDVLGALIRGDLDAHLEQVDVVLRARRRHLRELKGQEALTLAPGTRVRIVGNISPRYLAGVTGTVRRVEARGAKGLVRIDVDPGCGTGRYPRADLGVPASCVEAL